MATEVATERPRVAVLGASRGVGRALCVLLAQSGARVTALARSLGALDALGVELGADRCEAVVCDARDPSSLASAVERAGELDALVYCAALADPVRAPDEAALEALFSVNALGALRAARAFAPALERRAGRVVFVSSEAAVSPRPGMPAYASSKAALEGLARALAADTSAGLTSVYAVRIPSVATEMTRARVSPDEFAALPDAATAARALHVALGLDAALAHGRVLDGARLLRAPRDEEALAHEASSMGPFVLARPRFEGAPIERGAGAARGLRMLDRFEGPLGPSPAAREALARMAREPDCGAYPDEDEALLRVAFADAHGASASAVVPGAGATELVERVVRTFTRSGETAVFLSPTWPGFERIARAHGLALRPAAHALSGDRARFDPDALAEHCAGARLLYLASPENPLGRALDAGAFAALVARLPRSVTVLVDEAYAEFCTRAGALDAARFCAEAGPAAPRVVAVRTLSKLYALAGYRVGCAVTDAQSARHLRFLGLPYSVGRVASEVAVAALRDRAHVERSRAACASERARLSTELRALGCEVLDSDANFLLADLRTHDAHFTVACEARGLVLPPGRFFDGGRFRYVPVARPADSDAMLDALRESREFLS